MARRYKSLHHNLQPGENVVFHREHRSPRNRNFKKIGALQKYKVKSRRDFKNFIKSQLSIAPDGGLWKKKKK